MHSGCASQAHRTFAAFVMNGFVMLPDRRRKGSAGSALEAGSEGAEMQQQEQQEEPLEATVRCGTWSQLRRHLRLEFVSKRGGGAATDSLDGPGALQGDELEESPADTGSFPARLRELVREFPKLSLELSAFEAENSSQDPLEAHVALARCLALLRKRARADLWDLLAKAGPARAGRQRPACACRGISHGTVLLCGMAPIRGRARRSPVVHLQQGHAVVAIGCPFGVVPERPSVYRTIQRLRRTWSSRTTQSSRRVQAESWRKVPCRPRLPPRGFPGRKVAQRECGLARRRSIRSAVAPQVCTSVRTGYRSPWRPNSADGTRRSDPGPLA